VACIVKRDIILKNNAKSFNPSISNVAKKGQVPSILDTSIEPGSRKNILLIKVPYCVHHESSIHQDGKNSEEIVKDFRTRTPWKPIPSLAIATLAAFFEKHKTYDYNLRCIDINVEGYTNPDEVINTNSYIDIIKKTISTEDYDILAVSAMFVMTHRWVVDTVKLSKKYHPDSKIIIGGGYPTIYPEYTLQNDGIDVSILGEGEDTFLNVVNRLNNIVDDDFEKAFPFEGYAAKDESGNVFVVPREHGYIDLEELPPTAWDWMDIKNYFNRSGNNCLPIEASRGCPFKCTYCTSFISWGRKVRYKSKNNLIAEISDIKSRYEAAVHFVDDNFSFDRKWTVDFLSTLADKKLNLDASCSNFHYNSLDEEILELLFKVGVNDICFAIEAGSPEILKRIKRTFNKEKALKIIDYIRKRKRTSIAFWMVGFPNETLDQINMTFDLARELKTTTNLFSVVMPYPGTALWDYAKETGALIVDDESIIDLFYYRSSKGNLRSEHWTNNELITMMYDFNIEYNFINNADLETDFGQDALRSWLEDTLLRSLPTHIIGNILLGYLYKEGKENVKANGYFKKAKELFSDEELKTAFEKYLSWDNKVIKSYLDYVGNN